MKESYLQSKIISQLQEWGWMVIKLIQTNKNGIPDLLAIRNGKAVFIEVKRPGYEPAPLQKYRLNEINEKGVMAFWVDNIDDINFLKKW